MWRSEISTQCDQYYLWRKHGRRLATCCLARCGRRKIPKASNVWKAASYLLSSQVWTTKDAKSQQRILATCTFYTAIDATEYLLWSQPINHPKCLFSIDFHHSLNKRLLSSSFCHSTIATAIIHLHRKDFASRGVATTRAKHLSGLPCDKLPCTV